MLNGVVQGKLSVIAEYRDHLEKELRKVDRDRFTQDWGLQRMAERALQVMVEAMVDIGTRILAIRGKGPVKSSADLMALLVDMGILTSAEPYVSMVRFRNLLVHLYETVDVDILWTILTEHLNDFRRFPAEIERNA